MCPFRIKPSLHIKHGFTWLDTLHEVQLHGEEIGVWYAVSHTRIVVPMLFECAVDELDEHDCWFQQDGATCHSANETTNMFRGCFIEPLLSKSVWPPCSHSLTPPEFFLWIHLKERSHKGNPRMLSNLKKAISQAINDITLAVLRRVSRNVRNHVELCLQKI
ncbi:hypothetical protein Cfor_02923, partial [Coptotermes formosanus]